MNDQLNRSRRWFRVMLILTFIGSGSSLFNNLYMGLMYPLLSQWFQNGTMAGQISMMSQMMGVDPSMLNETFENMLSYPRAYYGISALLYAVSLTGAIIMWRERKVGFHCYSIAQALILIIMVMFLGKAQVGVGNVMFTLLFIVYYFVTLKGFGVFNTASDNSDTSMKDDENAEKE